MISVVLPAYREAENLRSILPRLHRVLRDVEHEILILDTMTPLDDTAAVCAANQSRCIPRRGGNTYGDAIRTGFAEAAGEYTVVMDADGSHDPQDILRFLQQMETGRYDLVIGSRYCKGGHTDNNLILQAMSWTLNVTYRIFLGLKVKDASDSFRLYKTDTVKDLPLECQNFDLVEELLVKLTLSKPSFAIKEVPISFHKRAAGESKRDLVKFVFSYLQTLRRLMRIRRDFRKSNA